MLNDATKKQRWAIFTLTKKDVRNIQLSKEEASRIIEEAIKSKGGKPGITKESFVRYFKDNIDVFTKEFKNIAKQVSIIEDDVNPLGKKYLFFGGGCGFAHIKYDKRNKKMNSIVNISGECFDDCCKAFINSFDKETQRYFESTGNPLGAIFYQDMQMQISFKHLVLNYAKECGVDTKNMYIHSWLD